MRERLVAAFVGLTVLVVALYGIPRAYFLADLVRSDEQVRVDRTADVLALLLDERIAAGRPVSTAYLDSVAARGEHVQVSGPQGTVSSTSGPQDLAASVRATRQLTGGGRVTVVRTATAVGHEISGALLPLVLLGLLLAVLAAVAGFALAGRLARPFRRLAVVAEDLGAGRLHPDVPDYRVPEARAIGRALVDSGRRLDALLEGEREVAVHASHELRTPVTALRLELEDLALWPETPPRVAAELQRAVTELDRLSAAVTDLLELSRTRRAEAEIDLDLEALVADVVGRLREARVRVVQEPGAPAPTRLDPAPVSQALELLVDGLREEGASRIVMTVVPHSRHYEVRVGADGDGPDPTPSGPSASTSWSRAGELAAAAGGQLSRDGRVRVLRLPRRPVRTAAAAGTVPGPVHEAGRSGE